MIEWWKFGVMFFVIVILPVLIFYVRFSRDRWVSKDSDRWNRVQHISEMEHDLNLLPCSWDGCYKCSYPERLSLDVRRTGLAPSYKSLIGAAWDRQMVDVCRFDDRDRTYKSMVPLPPAPTALPDKIRK